MYLEEQNSDLNDEINDLICLSNDLTSIEDRLAVKLKAWSLIPEPKINWVEPTSSVANGISGVYEETGDYKAALEWVLLALKARKIEPDASIFCDAGAIYFELGDMDNAYKYFQLAYNELRYQPFSYRDRKYWQFYKQRKEEINPKKKTKK